ncbi:MAG: hypothetical protein D6744_13125 [Planctomycetota bacterium]|nr:MAG: hypothetical protein D6744_13125 [Planctomycetota bacterium]
MKTMTAVTMTLVALWQAAAAAAQNCTPCIDPAVPDLAIVQLAPGRTISEAIAAIESRQSGLTATVLDSVPSREVYLLGFDPPGVFDAVLFDLQYFMPGTPNTLIGDGSDPSRPLMFGDTEYTAEIAEGKTGSGYVSGPALTAAHFQGQYALAQTNVAAAQMRSTGSGVVVAVIDTGIDATHPALGNSVAPGWNVRENSSNTADVGDGADNDGDGVTDEGVGHGTYVAGLIHLVAPDATLVPVVVLDSEGRTSQWLLLKGIYWAIDRGVEVINISIGTTYDADTVEAALDEAKLYGIVPVGAAGNCGCDLREQPAMKSSVLGVVSVNDQDIKADFSNYNRKASLAAPGDSVPDAGDPTGYDTARSMFGPVPGGGYAVWEGTSLSAPLVSGAVALVRAQHPEWAYNDLTWDAIDNLLANTATPIDGINPGFAGSLGAGRIDIGAAVQMGPPQPQLGDLNNDGTIGLSDLALLLADFDQVHSSADLDGSGRVDLADLAMMLSAFN